MRTLFLLRHAKSSWADPTLPDHDRPLAPRGERAAERMAAHLRAEAIRPTLVLCSPARRAVATLAALQRDFDRRTEVRIEDAVYGADAWSLLARLHDVGPPTSSVMIVGHNPGLEDLTRMMAGDGEALALARLRAKFPTGALAVLDLGDATWSQLRAGRAYLTALVLPRELPG